MNPEFRDLFIHQWKKYFGKAELPLIFYYSDTNREAKILEDGGERCMIGNLNLVRNGKNIAFTRKSILCRGGKLYSGFSGGKYWHKLPEFLSCGIEGQLEGERYAKTPALAKQALDQMPLFSTDKKYLIFKRWDNLTADDEPEVVIFYSSMDVLAGLFTLANFDSGGIEKVIAPFASGCGAIIAMPLAEAGKETPRAILGMFDPSARPYIESEKVTMAIPFGRFKEMFSNFKESFLTTDTWKKILHRIEE